MSYELITVLMFALMMLMLATGQRVFAAIGFVAVLSALLLWGDRGGYDLGFAAAMKLMKWYPLLTLPMFIFMGYVLSESKIADDLYRMFHVWTGAWPAGSPWGRQWWYWGGEASLRVHGTKMQLTSIPDEEWAQVEAAARVFWDEIAAESDIKAKVVDIFKQYNADMEKAGRPYRYT